MTQSPPSLDVDDDDDDDNNNDKDNEAHILSETCENAFFCDRRTSYEIKTPHSESDQKITYLKPIHVLE
jgi:hypothetical protein